MIVFIYAPSSAEFICQGHKYKKVQQPLLHHDALGNRVTKTANNKTTIYIRDASGNVISVYEQLVGGVLAQIETHVYGSSRLGIVTSRTITPVNITLVAGYGKPILSTFIRGEKLFELTNHLGNVLVTVTDKKLPHSTDGANWDYYDADVASAVDYYPFGMQVVGRNYTAPSLNYRYGFNGKENDNEVYGQGNESDYGFRIYNSRIGKFLNVDPLTKKYPELTPYQFATNRPIDGVDLEGLEWAPTKDTPIQKCKLVDRLNLECSISFLGKNDL